MGRFLFSTAPLQGHLDWGGLLTTAQHLQNSGHDVVFVSGPEVAATVNEADLAFIPVPTAFQLPASAPEVSLDATQFYALELQRTLDVWMQVDQVAAACDAHLEIIARWRPDVVIADPLLLAAALAAEACAVPLAGCGYPGPYMVFKSLPETQTTIADLYARLNVLRRRIGLAEALETPDPDFLFIAPRLQLVFFPPDWFAAYNPHPSPGVQFVGGQARLAPTPAPSWLAELPGDRPLVVVAQSTIYGPPVSQLPLIFEAVGQIGGYALVGGSLDKRQACEPLPDYVRWESWLDYAHVLPHAAAIVHHGGMGTTHAAVCHALPQVVTPAAADQFLHAERVMAQKVGVAIPPQHGRSAVIAAALKEVIEKAQYRHAAMRLQAEFARYGGVARAAELLIQLAFMNSYV